MFVSFEKSNNFAFSSITVYVSFLNQQEQENRLPKVKGGMDKYCPVVSLDSLAGKVFRFKHVDPTGLILGLSLFITLAPLFKVASSTVHPDPEFITFDEDSVSNLYQMYGTADANDVVDDVVTNDVVDDVADDVVIDDVLMDDMAGDGVVIVFL